MVKLHWIIDTDKFIFYIYVNHNYKIDDRKKIVH